jgi:hypothetical protein
LCCSRGFSNAFGIQSSKKIIADSDVKDHIKGRDHKNAELLVANVSRTFLFDTAKTKYEKEKLEPHFRNVYFLAKEDIALWKSSQLHKLSQLNGVEMISNYRTHKAAKEMLLAIAKEIEDSIFSLIRESDYISVLIDDSSDITHTHQLSVCVRYIQKNFLQERFLGILEMENLDANYIKEVLVKFLDSHQLISKVIALATDGAAKMVSKKEGVFGNLKRMIPHLRSIHCVAHKVALGLSDLEQQFNQIRTVLKLIHRIILL